MSFRKGVLLVVFGFCSLGGFGQGELFNTLRESIKANNAKDIVKHFNQSVDINIEGDINSYSKAQAEFVLRDFFKRHAATDFNVLHTGSSPNGLKYAIGKYQSGNDSYSFLIRVRENDKQFLVHEISFIKE
ncbi:MAG: DUF4783 domain-containing protein [Cytophagales bacterium]